MTAVDDESTADRATGVMAEPERLARVPGSATDTMSVMVHAKMRRPGYPAPSVAVTVTA